MSHEDVLKTFHFDDRQWLDDPKTATAQLVETLAKAASMKAEAEAEHAAAELELDVWVATKASDLNAKSKGKLPKWKVDVEVEADPEFLARSKHVVVTEAAATQMKEIVGALKRKAWYIGLLFDLRIINFDD